MISKIYREGEGEHAQDYLWFWCAGCNTNHRVPVTGPNAWGWNGSEESPTLTPSIRVRMDFSDRVPAKVCHSFVKDGQIQYLGDCTHELRGQTITLQDMP